MLWNRDSRIRSYYYRIGSSYSRFETPESGVHYSESGVYTPESWDFILKSGGCTLKSSQFVLRNHCLLLHYHRFLVHYRQFLLHYNPPTQFIHYTKDKQLLCYLDSFVWHFCSSAYNYFFNEFIKGSYINFLFFIYRVTFWSGPNLMSFRGEGCQYGGDSSFLVKIPHFWCENSSFFSKEVGRPEKHS